MVKMLKCFHLFNQKSSLILGICRPYSNTSFACCSKSVNLSNLLSRQSQNSSVLPTIQKRHLSRDSAFVSKLVEIQTSIFDTISYSAPVHYTQEALVFIHSTTGLEWGPTVVMSAFLVRFVFTFPLAVYQVGTVLDFFFFNFLDYLPIHLDFMLWNKKRFMKDF